MSTFRVRFLSLTPKDPPPQVVVTSANALEAEHIDAFKMDELHTLDTIETVNENGIQNESHREMVKQVEETHPLNQDQQVQQKRQSNKHRPDPIVVNHQTLTSTSSASGFDTPLYTRTPEQIASLSSIWKREGRKSMVNMLSAVYGILLVVMGVAFPISQVISSKISSTYYEGFYTYLYIVAVAFFSYVYLLLKNQLSWDLDLARRWSLVCTRIGLKNNALNKKAVFDFGDTSRSEVVTNRLRAKLNRELDPTKSANNHGSFYLRIGAVVFGVGSMIYSGLEFGQYFELSSNPQCNNPMMAIQPAVMMLFTFFQMYFVFLNAKMQILKGANIFISRFGLMHLTATNLCVWLNVIVQETNHEMVHFILGKHGGDATGHGADGHEADGHKGLTVNDAINHIINGTGGNDGTPDDDGYTLRLRHHHQITRRSTPDECHRTNLMGTLTQNASPFLFPCAIEYSLICAAVMYEIWKHTAHGDQHESGIESTRSGSPTGTPRGYHTPRTPGGSSYAGSNHRRSPHHYSVDCTNANKGLFFGIFVLVMTIISMILFFVLINREDYKEMAVTEVHLSELILYFLTLAAVMLGIIQVGQLQFDSTRKLDLDNSLLVVALTGVISYNIFTIVSCVHTGTEFVEHLDTLLVLLNALVAVIQGILQTIFVLDASKRHLFTQRQLKRKPGREVITFLMVTNFAMWAVITLEKSRFDAHPIQAEFFGQIPWAIITNISSPLAIFYRYHSTVCLCEIWKRCYKIRTPDL